MIYTIQECGGAGQCAARVHARAVVPVLPLLHRCGRLELNQLVFGPSFLHHPLSRTMFGFWRRQQHAAVQTRRGVRSYRHLMQRFPLVRTGLHFTYPQDKRRAKELVEGRPLLVGEEGGEA